MAYGVEERAYERDWSAHWLQSEGSQEQAGRPVADRPSMLGAIRPISVGSASNAAIGLTDPSAGSSPKSTVTEFRNPSSVQSLWRPDVQQLGFVFSRANVSNARADIRGRVSGPVKAFLSLLDRWNLNAYEGATLLGENDPNLIGDLRSGVVGVETRDRRDRVRCVLEIYTIVNRLLRDSPVERRWIRESRPELNNRSLIKVMLVGGLEDLILAREFVEEITGR